MVARLMPLFCNFLFFSDSGYFRILFLQHWWVGVCATQHDLFALLLITAFAIYFVLLSESWVFSVFFQLYYRMIFLMISRRKRLRYEKEILVVIRRVVTYKISTRSIKASLVESTSVVLLLETCNM